MVHHRHRNIQVRKQFPWPHMAVDAARVRIDRAGVADMRFGACRGRMDGSGAMALQAGRLVGFEIGADVGMGIVAHQAGENISLPGAAARAQQRIGLETMGLGGLRAFQIDVAGCAMAFAAERVQAVRLPGAEFFHLQMRQIPGAHRLDMRLARPVAGLAADPKEAGLRGQAV